MSEKDLNAYVAKLESLLQDVEIDKNVQDEDKTMKIVEMLTVALADQLLSAYQYWVCKNMVRGNGRSDVIPQFEQHYKDELEHADEIMLRIKELGGNPIPNPSDWVEIANPWKEINTKSACKQLDITIQAQQDAIDYYNKIIDFCRGNDQVTMRICRSILTDETQHLYDLKMLREQICE